jgi:hypothetical protein
VLGEDVEIDLVGNIAREGDECDVPHHLWLERPLGDRVVVDGTNGRRLEARPAPVN